MSRFQYNKMKSGSISLMYGIRLRRANLMFQKNNNTFSDNILLFFYQQQFLSIKTSTRFYYDIWNHLPWTLDKLSSEKRNCLLIHILKWWTLLSSFDVAFSQQSLKTTTTTNKNSSSISKTTFQSRLKTIRLRGGNTFLENNFKLYFSLF